MRTASILGYYAASSGNSLPTFRDNISVPSSRYSNPSWIRPLKDSCPVKMGPIICPEKSLKNCHYLLRNNQEERSSLLLRGGSLQSRRVRPFLRLSTSGSYFTVLENSECQVALFDFLFACKCFSHKYIIRQKL